MKGFRLEVFVVFFIAVLLNNCSAGKKSSKETSQKEATSIATDSTFGNIKFTAAQYAGMKLFMQNCNKCHPAGKKGKGPSLIEKKPSQFVIHWQVRLGFGPMPRFSKDKISNKELKEIISFVKVLEEKG